MCALVLRLPFDILGHVVETLDRPDLLSLALSCTTWKHIIIPHHLEYREISLSVDHHNIWKHLAERPSLAANVRRLIITESEYYHSFISFPPINFFRWRIPTTLVPPLSDGDTLSHAYAPQSDHPLRALRNMRLLKTIEFENIFRWAQGSPDTLSLFLAHIPSVENLVLKSSRSRGTASDGSHEGIGAEVSNICRI